MTEQPGRNGYHDLIERLNKYPQGAPASELLYKILAILFSEREAALVAVLPLRPFTAAKAARLWKVSGSQACRTLEELASRAILIDLEHEDQTTYFLPPPMVGFFEFSLMRVRQDIDQKELAGLFFQYINVKEEFIRELLQKGETKIGRVFVNETALSPELTTQVLDYERASEVIRAASAIAVGLCYCRHKMARLDRACAAPLDNCLTLNKVAQSLIRHGTARRIDAIEGLDLLQQARARNLVQCGDNVQHQVNFLCNCCGCCCEAMHAWRRLAIPRRQFSTNFMTHFDTGACNGCGRCVKICPVQAITLASDSGSGEGSERRGSSCRGQGDDEGREDSCQGQGVSVEGRCRRRAVVSQEICLGCGVCVANCPSGAIRLEPRPNRIITPVNAAHRLVLMAIERGKLQNLIFDSQAHLSHRAMAVILGAILRLGPVQRLLASRQLKSRFLERILKDVDIADLPD